jgi:hypothetical protein
MKVLESIFSNSTISLLVLALAIFPVTPTSASTLSKKQMQSFQITEGKVTPSVITIGPFDLHRKYRSMEGPYSLFGVKPGDLAASKQIEIPEAMVNFVETSNSAPGMMGSSADPPSNSRVRGLVDTSKQTRTLLWLKGVKLQVLDENNRVLPTAEFICHFNIDTNPGFRNRIFWQAERCQISRLITLTQGQTDMTFPEGYGVPVASDEPWTIIFQAANRTTNKHRRVKHRCTLYFIKDSELMHPITALNWFAPFVYVNVDTNSAQMAKEEKANCLSCIGTSVGVNAPTNISNGTFVDHTGHRMSGHWVIPPGNHSYSTPINDDRQPSFAAKPRILHAVWSHVHPLCTNLALYNCQNHARTQIFSVTSNTETKHGLEITNIDYWNSKNGVLLPGKTTYELEVTYKNSTGVPQDAMASAGMFFTDSIFVRPEWALAGKSGKILTR